MVEFASKPSDASEPLVRLESLCVDFRRHAVLREIDLSVARGETVAIIGESGCGKTVLLKTIIGLVRPTRGQVVFDGQDLSSLGERQLTDQRTRFGFLFQQAALFDSMTVAQNVAFPLRQHTSKPLDEIRGIVLSRLAEVGLPESAAGKKPAELSGGMRKRVGLARALAMEPEIMLYDEPTTGLDPIMSDVINELILRTRRRAPGDQRRRDARHAHGAEGGRPRGHALSAFASASGRAASPLRRPARSARRRRGTPRGAVRPRRGGRAPHGNAGRRRRLKSWTNASCNSAWA